MIRVAVNGYGTIGRRVAYACSIQDDMDVVGIVKTRPDYISQIASKKYDVYVPDAKALDRFRSAGINAKGTLHDLLGIADIVVDSTPEGTGAVNAPVYRASKRKAVFQGGEESGVAEASFNSYSNYSDSISKESTRVVSCNTTGMARSIAPLLKTFGVKKVRATLIRRAADQNDSKTGPINAIEPSLKIPSHHAEDLKTVLGPLDVETTAFKVSTTLMHVHNISVETEKKPDIDSILDIWRSRRRIMIISGKDGRASTAQVLDMAREMGRDRSDLYELAIWKESVFIRDNNVSYIQAVHQESIVVPENVDAIRAVSGITNGDESMTMTDSKLNIRGTVF